MMKEAVTIQPDGRNLLEILTGQFYELPSFCAGRGTCKKCKVRIKEEGKEEEVVLACQYIPLRTCQVEFLQQEGEFWIETDIQKEENKKEKEFIKKDQEETEESENFQIAVDIGTTTLALLLFNRQGKVLSSWTKLNPQRRYGADVISRIEKANNGQREELTDCIREEILVGLKSLCSKEERKVFRVVIAGNTTMQHLFAGYSVEGLGAYPFTVVRKDLVKGKLKEFYPILPKELFSAEYVFMPCISAFVGGDIMAGMLEAERQQEKRRKTNLPGSWLMLDIGTNGEMVLYHGGIYYTASAAAGPVFEGGNISCGIGSVTGAIDHIWEENGELIYSTIGGQIPVGICGTGLIESMAVLRKTGILERDGLLKGYEKSGYLLARGADGDEIRITQEDIRQFQLAKAAIRSGIEILCKAADIMVQKLDQVYLAGGFGTKLDIKKSCEVGLLPWIPKSRYCVLGNTSLSGCCRYGTEEDAEEILKRMQRSSKEITLALEGEFQKQYLEYMYF